MRGEGRRREWRGEGTGREGGEGKGGDRRLRRGGLYGNVAEPRRFSALNPPLACICMGDADGVQL